MFRDIRKNISQFISIFLMIMIGIMAYSGIESYIAGMTHASDRFYSENNLQDLSIMGLFGKDALEEVKELDHVKDAELKLSVTANTDKENVLLLNFIESNKISKFHVYKGDSFDYENDGIWLDNYYAIENHIEVGDEILVKYEDYVLHPKVAGLINVPDHLYDRRDESEIFPDRKKFGFSYMSSNILSNSGMPFSSIMVDVDDKSHNNGVKEAIEDKIPSAQAIIASEDTLSYLTYQGEIDEGKTYIGVFSGIFIFISMLSVITTMTRVVDKQRTQIGTLKAIGFTNRKILFHYIGYGIWISIFAGIVGLIFGYYFIGKVFMNLEMGFFEMPNGKPVMNTNSYFVAVAVVLVTGLITYITGRSILKENPAESLRTKTPKVNNRILNITRYKAFKNLKFEVMWNVRDILRNKARTFMGFCGFLGCCALIVCALGMLDSMNHFIKLQFEDIYNFEYKLNLKDGLDEEQLESLYEKYGKHTSKSFGIEIKGEDDIKEANNIFITDAGNLVRFIDENNNLKEGPGDNGVFVTYKLAEVNGYEIGDEISWHIYGDSKYYTSKIIGFNRDSQNQNVTMTRKYFESLGITYKPDNLYTDENLKGVKEIENVDSIQAIESLRETMNNLISRMKNMIFMIIAVGVILGVVIIYNLGILSYTEKEFQFATLKVLGFKDKQIERIFIKQNNWIALASVALGMPTGYQLNSWLFNNAVADSYDFNANIQTISYIIGAVGTLVVSYVVSKLLARKIKKIDMVTSLKGNE